MNWSQAQITNYYYTKLESDTEYEQHKTRARLDQHILNSNNVGATRNWSQAQSRYYTILESGRAKELHKNMYRLRQTPNYRHAQNKGDTRRDIRKVQSK